MSDLEKSAEEFEENLRKQNQLMREDFEEHERREKERQIIFGNFMATILPDSFDHV